MNQPDDLEIIRKLAESEYRRLRKRFPASAAAFDLSITARPVDTAFLVGGQLFGTAEAAEEARQALIMQELYKLEYLLN